MNIQGLPGGLVQNTGDSAAMAQAQEASQGRPPMAAATEQRPDTFSLTDSAARLRNLESSLAGLPVVDSQRVEGVQRSLATGSFVVDPVSTADKMLEMERQLP